MAALDEGLPRGCRFLGSHPLAGSEKAGVTHARADLFDGRVAVITPTRNTRAEDFDLLEEFWEALGSVVVRMSAEEHDRALAVTSHLPHLAAAALATTVPEQYYRLSGTGILDTTRLAGGDPRAVEADPPAEPRQRAGRAGACSARSCRPSTSPCATATRPNWNDSSPPRRRTEMLWEVDIHPADGQPDVLGRQVAATAAELGLARDLTVAGAAGYLIQGALDRGQVERIARELLADGVVERTVVDAGGRRCADGLPR